MENDRFLPIGSVVSLRGGTKKIMITGYCAVLDGEPNKIYDYNGCMYPEGFLSSDQVCLFQHEQIEKIFFRGYQDQEGIEFTTKLLNLKEEFVFPSEKKIDTLDEA